MREFLIIQLLLQVCSIKQLFQLFTNISNISNDAIECDEIEKDDCDSLLHKINVLTAQLKIKDEKFEDLK